MKPIVRNILVLILAVVGDNEINFRFFNQDTIMNWQLADVFPFQFSSFYLEHLTIFLFLSIPEIFAAFVMSKLLVGRFKICWCLGASLLLLYSHHPIFWQATDMSLVGKIIAYTAYYLHPLSLAIFAFVLLNWPNPSFKRDTLKRAP